MGDSGSTLIGFTVVWLLISSSQTAGHTTIRPVTALWLIAVPLMDMAAVILRRIQNETPFWQADQKHFHHILLTAGFSPKKVLVIIAVLSSLFASIGICGELFSVHESIQFVMFLVCFYLFVKITNFVSNKSSA